MAGKLIGSILVLAACFLMGYRLSIREKLSLQEILYFKSAITKIMSELEHNRAAFCDALAASVNLEENDVFASIYNAVKNNNSVKTAWKYAFEENADDFYMEKCDRERLSELGEGFGSSDIELQKKYVKNALDYISGREAVMGEKLERDKRLYRSVSITVGLFIVILLI